MDAYLDDAEVLVDDLGERRQAVRGARRVGHDVVRRRRCAEGVVVDPHHKHGRVILRRRRDDCNGHNDATGVACKATLPGETLCVNARCRRCTTTYRHAWRRHPDAPWPWAVAAGAGGERH